jgi:hypothetical protein
MESKTGGASLSRREDWLLYGMATAALLLSLNLALFAAHSAERPSNGYVAYYTAAQLLRDGERVQDFYDDAWFAARIAERGPAIYDTFAPNPPTTALLLLPLAGLDPSTARSLWTLLNLGAYLGFLALMLKALELPRSWAAAFLLLAMAYQPVYASLGQGQCYLLLLGLLSVAWHGFRTRRPSVVGIALGLLLSLKIAGAFLWLLLLVRRQWSALAWGIATTLIAILASLPWLKPESWGEYLAVLPAYNSRPDLLVTAYQSFPAFLRHLFTYDAGRNPLPLIELPAAAVGLSALGTGVMLGVGCYSAWRNRESDSAFSTFVLATLVLNPLTLEYHYPLALLPLAVAWAWVSRRATLGPVLLLGVAASILAFDLPYLSGRLANGAWSLLAYPRLYGALLLGGLTLWISLQGEAGARAAPLEQRQGEDGTDYPGQQSRDRGPRGAEDRY